MIKLAYTPYELRFHQPAVTSRGTMLTKPTYFIKVWDSEDPSRFGLGECALFKGLSSDDRPNYEEMLEHLCRSLSNGETCDVSDWSSIRFGLESALIDFDRGCRHIPFPSEWTQGNSTISINGLVWMGTIEEMTTRVDRKINEGFRCVKLKIGGQDFESEMRLLDRVRLAHGPEELEIRLDANGAFTPDNAMERLQRLSQLDIHSIEQPIRQGQWDAMSYICANSPVPVALDEELIGIADQAQMHKLLYYIAPQYIILKPSLCGGFSGAAQWIETAEKMSIGWWVTSALESDVGLNAIAQWTATLDTGIPQGLGTGQLYANNIPSPLRLVGDKLSYDPTASWVFPDFTWKS